MEGVFLIFGFGRREGRREGKVQQATAGGREASHVFGFEVFLELEEDEEGRSRYRQAKERDDEEGEGGVLPFFVVLSKCLRCFWWFTTC